MAWVEPAAVILLNGHTVHVKLPSQYLVWAYRSVLLSSLVTEASFWNELWLLQRLIIAQCAENGWMLSLQWDIWVRPSKAQGTSQKKGWEESKIRRRKSAVAAGLRLLHMSRTLLSWTHYLQRLHKFGSINNYTMDRVSYCQELNLRNTRNTFKTFPPSVPGSLGVRMRTLGVRACREKESFCQNIGNPFTRRTEVSKVTVVSVFLTGECE